MDKLNREQAQLIINSIGFQNIYLDKWGRDRARNIVGSYENEDYTIANEKFSVSMYLKVISGHNYKEKDINIKDIYIGGEQYLLDDESLRTQIKNTILNALEF